MAQPKTRKSSRKWVTIAVVAMLTVGFVYAFWPRATPVDIGTVARSPMTLTIDEEARTRVRDAYVVSAPIAGHLLRVEVDPGDAVVGGETVIARMLANPPSAIDVRTREQARAGVDIALAGLRVSRADLNKALADQDLANADLARARTLAATGTASHAALDQAERLARAANASVDTAKAAISMREAELANARARLIGFDQPPSGGGLAEAPDATIPLSAPISGRILRIIQESETTVAPGQPILEIGDISNDLEVVAELLSTDAVQVSPGDRVIIDNWGGQPPLNGIVERIEPWGFTKFSALGVEEQRVNTVIRFTDPLSARSSLGHGYRVEARIVVWESDQALIVPSSSLFRSNGGWAVFTVESGRARLTPVEIGHNNGLQAELLSDLPEGTRLILYPGPGLQENARVTQRYTGG
ncbi:MAG: HlyD family efflux transporter periplasmic adaptor subunit [Alphaproteobacteria bacterium]|nr:HlyD family efflux transporter periplasmic adaptor subunit [Alphaproteobacteria bacterium]